MKKRGRGKRGDLSITIEPLLRIVVWVLPFFFTMLFFTNSYADQAMIVRETYAVDAGLLIEALQAANGNIAYNYNNPYDFLLKEKTIYFPINSEQNIRYEFAKDASKTFHDSQAISGSVSMIANGNEVTIIKNSGNEKEEKLKAKLSCKKRDSPLENYSLAIDPAHGGTETGMVFESNTEGKITFFIADTFKTFYRKELDITLTREGEHIFASDEERIRAAEGKDIMISIHIGGAENKGRITMYVPDDARMKESEMLACAIANEFFASHDISYPYSVPAKGDTHILKSGDVAAVQIEIGTMEDRQSFQKIAESIKKGVVKYAHD